MFLVCLRKELLLNIKSMRLLLTSGLLVFTMLAATAVRGVLYLREREDTQKARIAWMALQDFTCNTETSLGVGTMVEAEPRALSIFAGGLGNEMSRALRLRYRPHDGEQPPLPGRRRLSNPAFRQFFMLDPALLVALVGSLFALVLIFDAIGAEREQGTLALQMAGPLPRDTILGAKVTAGLITLVVPILLAWVASVAFLLLQLHIDFTSEEYQRLGVMVALSVLLVTAFFALGIAVSAWTRRSATALGVCLLAWILQALIVPGAVPAVAGRLSAVPSTAKLAHQRSAVKQRAFDEETPKIVAEVMKKTGKKGWGELFEAGMGRMRDEAAQRAVARLEREYLTRLRRQGTLARQLTHVSPSATFLSCATALAGTGTADYYSLVSDMDRYRREADQARNDHTEVLKARGEKEKKWWQEFPFPASAWPALQETHASVGTVLGACWLDIAVLVLLAIGGLMAAYLGFMRSTVQ